MIRRFSAASTLMLASLGMSACERGLPPQTYEWSPPLQKTKGKLESFVSALPFGAAAAVEHRHPLDPDEDTITISNTRELMPFITRQEPALASAAAFYETNGTVSGAAYAALVAANSSPSKGKDWLYSGSPELLNPARIELTFHVRPVTGLLPADDPCQLFLVSVSAVQAADLRKYVVLAGARKNLYLELVAAGDLAEGAPNNSYDLKQPFEAKKDWQQESLKTLSRAHAETKLEVCNLPT